MAKNLVYPFSWEPLSDEEHSQRAKMFTGPATFNTNMVKLTPFGMNMPAKFPEYGRRIWEFEPRSDDIWIITYPKCGSTLTQELVWQVANGCDIDSEESKVHILMRVPFIEMTALNTKAMSVPMREDQEGSPENNMATMMYDTVAWAEKAKSPRIIKTHLPICMLPPNLLVVCKVIFVGRNPKDTCVSMFHHEKLMPNSGLDKNASFDDYSKLFMEGKLFYGDYWTFLKDGWRCRDNANFKFIWFEDLRADLGKTIKEIADFTGHAITDDQVDRLKNHLNIDNMKKNDAVNMKPPKGAVPDEVRENFNFIRKGKVGNWTEWFQDKDTLDAWNTWIQDNNPCHMIPIKYE